MLLPRKKKIVSPQGHSQTEIEAGYAVCLLKNSN